MSENQDTVIEVLQEEIERLKKKIETLQPKKVKCPHCSGSGQITKNPYDWNPPHYYTPYFTTKTV